MELENVNLNGDSVVTSHSKNSFNFFFLRIMKIEFKNECCMLLFLQDVVIAQNTKPPCCSLQQSIWNEPNLLL